MRIFLLLVLVVVATGVNAQVVLQKAVISSAGGTSANSTTQLNYTVGETAVGVASNGTTVGHFGFWHTPAAALSVKNSGAASIESVTIQPNPSTDVVTIRLQLKAASDIDLRLYNSAGQLMTTLFTGKKPTGSSTIRADISTLPSGKYYLAALVPGGLVQTQVTVVR